MMADLPALAAAFDPRRRHGVNEFFWGVAAYAP